jgi:hypothetical protein
MRFFTTTILLFFTAILFACGGYFSTPDNTNSNQANSIAPENTNIDANANLDLSNTNSNIQNLPVKRPSPTPKTDPLTRSAPDDSVITAENDAEGDLVETRIFKNHEMLAKVERILTASRRDGSIRVFLKNGRVYEIPVSRLKNVLNESPEEIIKTVRGEATAGSPAANKAQGDGKNGASPGKTSDTAPTPPRQ